MSVSAMNGAPSSSALATMASTSSPSCCVSTLSSRLTFWMPILTSIGGPPRCSRAGVRPADGHSAPQRCRVYVDPTAGGSGLLLGPGEATDPAPGKARDQVGCVVLADAAAVVEPEPGAH